LPSIPPSNHHIGIDANFLEGKRDKYRRSSYLWPQIRKPYLPSWEKWKEAVKETFCGNQNSLQLKKPLGSFEKIPNSWKWFYSRTSNTVYYSDGSIYKRYIKYESSRDTRSSLRWYILKDIVNRVDVKDYLELATISTSTSDDTMIALEGSSPSITKAIREPDMQNLFHILESSITPSWMYSHQKAYLCQFSPDYIKSFFSHSITIVSDGSYKDNVGAAGIIIENYELNQRFILSTPVPANQSIIENDSYRSEFVGVLYGLHFLQAVSSIRDNQVQVQIGCDNDSVLEVAELHDYITINTKHRDVVSSLLVVREMLSDYSIQYHRAEASPFPKSSSQKGRLWTPRRFEYYASSW